jgi:hypothetical protein
MGLKCLRYYTLKILTLFLTLFIYIGDTKECVPFEGLCHEIFDLRFFSIELRIKLRIRRDIRLWNHRFYDQRCQWHHWPKISWVDPIFFSVCL